MKTIVATGVSESSFYMIPTYDTIDNNRYIGLSSRFRVSNSFPGTEPFLSDHSSTYGPTTPYLLLNGKTRILAFPSLRFHYRLTKLLACAWLPWPYP